MARMISTSTYTAPAQAATLKALAQRQEEYETRAAKAAQMRQIADPWQGAAQLMDVFSNNFNAGRAERQETEGRQKFAQLIAGVDPTQGATPEQIQQMYTLDPDQGALYAADAMKVVRDRNAAAATQTREDQLAQRKHNQALELEREKARLAGETPPAWKPSDVGSLRDDYTKAAATYDNAAPAFQSMKEAAATALNPDIDVKGKGAADYNMIVAYAKMLDPTSVVREGEVKSASMTGGTLDQINGWLNIVKGQGSLSDDVRRGIMTEANSRMKAYYDQVKGKRDWVSGIATRHRLNPDDVVPPLAEFSPWAEQPREDPAAQPPQAGGAGAAGAGAGGAGGGIPDFHVKMLQDDPSPEAIREFDEAYGPGAAQKILGSGVGGGGAGVGGGAGGGFRIGGGGGGW